MFVLPSIDSKSTDKIISVEEKLRDKLQWKVKVLEQSGTPLAMTFIPRFELLNWCPKGDGCLIRECGGLKCAQRRVDYSAVCRECKNMGTAAESTYIGETCRPLRERAAEHRKNLLSGDPKSFQLIHWMERMEQVLHSLTLNLKSCQALEMPLDVSCVKDCKYYTQVQRDNFRLDLPHL